MIVNNHEIFFLFFSAVFQYCESFTWTNDEYLPDHARRYVCQGSDLDLDWGIQTDPNEEVSSVFVSQEQALEGDLLEALKEIKMLYTTMILIHD